MSRIDGAGPMKISTNFSVEQQSQAQSTGQKFAAGLANAGQGLASGAALLGGSIPGMGIVSSAISSAVTGLGGSPGRSTGSSAYAATGVVNIGGGTTATGGINTTVGNTGIGGGVVSTGGTTGGGVNLTSGSSSNNIGGMNNELAAASAQNAEMLKVQMAMQRENTMFTSISNVLKTRHETQKNSISNIR